jgi:hypothetical protein
MRRILLLSLATAGFAWAPAAAQTCRGLAALSASPIQATAEASLTQGSSSVGGGLSYGLPVGVFGSAELGTTSMEAFGGSSLDIGGSLGYQVTLPNVGGLELCPIASVGFQVGPKNNFHSGVNRSAWTGTLGLAAGTSLEANPRLKIVPTIGFSYGYRKDKAESSAGATLFEISNSYGLAQFGVGLVLNSDISVRPSMDIPLGLDGSDPIFGLTLGLNFGHIGPTAHRR